MGLITRLKSLLGLDEDGARSDRGDVGVTIEREPEHREDSDPEPVTETEVAVTGVDSATEAASPDAERSDAADEGRDTDATEVTTDDTDAVAESSPADATTDEAVSTESEADAPTGTGEPVDDIKGIGPAYANRLAEAGVDDIADLARADAAELAEQTDLSEKRIAGWIERAQSR